MEALSEEGILTVLRQIELDLGTGSLLRWPLER
jgi:hypothetical protein